MGANQSGGQQTNSQSNTSDNNNGQVGGILVVNRTPGTRHPESDFVLPKRVPPILTLDGNEIDPKRHQPNVDQLDPKLWSEFISNLGGFVDSRIELVVKRQAQLQEKVIQIDDHIQKLTVSYVSEQHRSLSRLNDECKKISEIDKMLEKCSIQSELCVSMLNKLNFLLPDSNKLEPLEP